MLGELRAFWTWFSVLCIASVMAITMATYQFVNGPHIPSADVKVMLAQGHGSGVYIGKGSIITAAHVVEGVSTVDIRLDDGTKAKADVLWSSKEFDIAHLRIRGEVSIQTAKLSCRVPEQGEEVVAIGNPSQFDDLVFRGFINGKPRDVGPWKNAVPADLTIIPGMSGGALYDTSGKVIGINVGTGVVPMGFVASWARIGVVVSGKTVCGLLGLA